MGRRAQTLPPPSLIRPTARSRECSADFRWLSAKQSRATDLASSSHSTIAGSREFHVPRHHQTMESMTGHLAFPSGSGSHNCLAGGWSVPQSALNEQPSSLCGRGIAWNTGSRERVAIELRPQDAVVLGHIYYCILVAAVERCDWSSRRARHFI